jgi:hypothetical protein
VSFTEKLPVDLDVGQEPNPKGKAIVTGGSTHSWETLDASQQDNPGASSSGGGSHVVLRLPVCSLLMSDVVMW